MGSEAAVVTSEVYCVVFLFRATKGFSLLPMLLTGLVRPMHTGTLVKVASPFYETVTWDSNMNADLGH